MGKVLSHKVNFYKENEVWQRWRMTWRKAPLAYVISTKNESKRGEEEKKLRIKTNTNCW